MAFDQPTRNRLQSFVTAARRTLEKEFTRQLQQDYGLDPISGTASPLENLRHINDQQRETARKLRDTLAHYCASANTDAKAGLHRIVRGQAFTILNRLAALKMAEARGLLIESVGNGYQAKGFQLYAHLAGAGLGEKGDAYRVYLQSVFDELSQDLPGLFDRFSPQGRLFPREAALIQVLTLINHGEIEPLWAEDETIGWIYQYFNSKEERKAMRDASQAPRNSRELAVRNQFFTPRYVVEFLVDNTLGRLWFNWTGGQTDLCDRCQYLLVKPDEQPEPAKRLRDPRTIKLLDPACGSMHFGLYAFDLFLEIYREAWAWEQTHGPGCLDAESGGNADLRPLSQTYADQDAFLHDVPRLIIEHNIYGVDIDPRAAQIASLALWLRAQRAWHEAGVKAKDRPRVGRGHVVAAVAPPAEVDLRKQFMEELDPLDAELFEKTLFLLKGLPELGVLLQVEKELPSLVRAVFGEHGDLFCEEDMARWQKAEARLQDALNEFARAARSNYQGRLFADDSLNGLRLINLQNKTFTLILMNPPFGLPSEGAKGYMRGTYPGNWTDYYNAFIKRADELLEKSGAIGAVVPDRLLFTKKSASIRKSLISDRPIRTLVDVRRDVMDDAAVNAIFFTAGGTESSTACAVLDLKEIDLENRPDTLRALSTDCESFIDTTFFDETPGNMFSYRAPKDLLLMLKKGVRLDPGLANVATGGKTFDDFRFLRLRWEIDPAGIAEKWFSVDTGGDFQVWYSPSVYLQNWADDGAELRAFAIGRRGTDAQAAQSSRYWFNPGLSYPYTSSIGFGPRILPKNTIFTSDAIAIHPKDGDPLAILSVLASSWIAEFLAYFGEGRKTENSLVKSLPIGSEAANSRELASIGQRAVEIMMEVESTKETSPIFSSLRLGSTTAMLRAELQDIVKNADRLTRSALGISGTRQPAIDAATLVEHFLGDLTDEKLAWIEFSYAVGVSFGHWVYPIDESDGYTPCKNLFEELPKTQPARAVQNKRAGSPILDVEGGKQCLEEMIKRYLRLRYSHKADEFEALICNRLGIRRISDALSSPGLFFEYHFRDYSRGGRKAPIYWPISTNSGSYTLWLYYPGLTDQTLFKAVNDFIQPKLKQVGQDVAALRTKGSARSRDDDKNFEALHVLELELIELRNTLLAIAQTYRPHLDDGVQITAAPLWQLFRHKPWQKVLKDTWGKLEKGDYDWARLAMAYWPGRVREKCKTDKSLAIAHELEHLYVEPEDRA